MKEFEKKCYSSDDLEEFGAGSIENGLKNLENDGWMLTSSDDDIQTGLKYYWFEREKYEI